MEKLTLTIKKINDYNSLVLEEDNDVVTYGSYDIGTKIYYSKELVDEAKRLIIENYHKGLKDCALKNIKEGKENRFKKFAKWICIDKNVDAIKYVYTFFSKEDLNYLKNICKRYDKNGNIRIYDTDLSCLDYLEENHSFFMDQKYYKVIYNLLYKIN